MCINIFTSNKVTDECPCPDYKPRMTRGIRHLTITFSNAVPISAKSRFGSLKISRLPPFVSLAEALQNLPPGPPHERVPASPESPEIVFNSLTLNLLNCICQIFSLLSWYGKGLQHRIEKERRGRPGEADPQVQAAPSGDGARRGP